MTGKSNIQTHRTLAKKSYKLHEIPLDLEGGGRGCVLQTTKKYRERPSPPYPANECKNLIFIGNDKEKWLSSFHRKSPSVGDVYVWKRENNKIPKSPKKPMKKSPKSPKQPTKKSPKSPKQQPTKKSPKSPKQPTKKSPKSPKKPKKSPAKKASPKNVKQFSSLVMKIIKEAIQLAGFNKKKTIDESLLKNAIRLSSGDKELLARAKNSQMNLSKQQLEMFMNAIQPLRSSAKTKMMFAGILSY